jgi:hypothetical protein
MTEYGKIHTDGSRSGGQPLVDSIRVKAHTMVLEVLAEWGLEPRSVTPKQLGVATTEALCRAIEQHEAFKQEVSDAVEAYLNPNNRIYSHSLNRFIIAKPKPDPLVEVLEEISGEGGFDNYDHYAHNIHAALEARGFEIREKGQ